MALYIGANYHPHDWDEERWSVDIRMMKDAGFTTVRLGHLCWDSYEPDNGVYTFEWFDKVMDMMAEAGINVVLDISMHPAPIWVHELCRGVNLGGINGDLQYPVKRYMDDVSDPEYQIYALRFAEVLVNRYKNHPALLAFGLCNELGWCSRSHSDESKRRFISWLKNKYGTIENLNKAWSTQRWCRKVLSFEQIDFPETEREVGSPEAWLDMRRFFSDGVGDFICKLQKQTKKLAPNIVTTSNHYAENPNMGFDYLKYYPDFVEYPGVGYYTSLTDPYGGMRVNNEMAHRITESDYPMWCIEFQTGGFGMHHGNPKQLRMVMMHCLLQRTQMILGWTWRTMLAGEEQFLVGMLEHDGLPNVNFEVYKNVAKEFKILEKYAFPYVPVPEIGVAESYDTDWVNQYPNNCMFKHNYAHGCMSEVVDAFRMLNREYNIVNLKAMKHEYKLLLLPEYAVITKEEADILRDYIYNGGTVIMTGYSAILNEHGSAYDITKPAGLADVFGIRVAGYNRPTEDTYVEMLELKGAKAYKTGENGEVLISMSEYGKGKAYYMASQAEANGIKELIAEIEEDIDLTPAVSVPNGVQARKISDNQYFYVNTTPDSLEVTLPKKGRFVLKDIEAAGKVILEGYDADLLVTEE